MVSYKDLGLVNTKEMFAKAIKGGYAIPAFNFNNMEQLQAIIQGCRRNQVSGDSSSFERRSSTMPTKHCLRYMAQGAVEYAKELGCANILEIVSAPRPRRFFRIVQILYRYGISLR